VGEHWNPRTRVLPETFYSLIPEESVYYKCKSIMRKYSAISIINPKKTVGPGDIGWSFRG
jgi:hypothetical protein